MIKNRRWTFLSKPGRGPLTAEEVHNLRNEISKTIKVGMEFEYNLPESKRSCSGDSPDCSCVNEKEVSPGISCADVCADTEICSIRKEGKCPTPQLLCPRFSLPCVSCDKFDLGCEKCPRHIDRNKSPSRLRELIAEDLKPTKFLGRLGKTGVLDVVADGSLSGEGGAEVVTVGRRVSFKSFYKMTKTIMDSVSKHFGFVDERTSVHYHLLTGYLSASKYNDRRPDYGLSETGERVFPLSAYDEKGRLILKDFENPVPEIVLANFHQLYRKFENAIIWLTSTGNNEMHLTRWVKFRRPMLRYSAAREPMSKMRESIASSGDNLRYAAVNYLPTAFDKDGNIERLHFEVRVCDGLLSPSAASAFACLFYALLIKSIDISRHGIVESGDKEYMSTAKKIQEVLCNNSGSWSGPRVSCTEAIGPYIPTLIEQSRELVTFVKPILLKEHPTFDILMSLAERPISLRRCSGQSWERIEYELNPGSGSNDSTNEADVMRAVDVGAVSECASLEEWLTEVSEDFGHEKTSVEKAVKSLVEKGLVRWDNSVGSIVSI